MAFTMITAVVGLAVLTSVSAILLSGEGSSAARGMLNANAPGLLAPLDTWQYGGHGSGAGKNFVTYTPPINQSLVTAFNGVAYGLPSPYPGKGVLAFGDDAFATIAPTGIVQIPMAIGSIAFFVNMGPGNPVPAGVSLSKANLCTIFSGQATTWSAINALLPNIPVKVVRRTDASGSTDVVEDYLTKVCKFSIVPLVQGPAPLVIAATSTSNMINQIFLNVGGIGYAVCGSFDVNGVVEEIAVQTNAPVPTAVKCQTADYTGFTIAAPKPTGAWYSVSITAGIKVNQYPTANILYAYARSSVTLATDALGEGYVAKKLLQAMSTVSFQTTVLPGYFFNPLPTTTLTTVTCKAIQALKVVTPAGRTALPVQVCPAP